MLYIAAAEIIEKAKNKEGNIKSLVFSSGLKNIKQLYALVVQTLKYSTVVQQVIAATNLLKQETWLKQSVANVMTYDLLFGKGSVRCRGKFKRAMKRHTPALESALANLKKNAKVSRNEDLLPRKIRDDVGLPRYVRVNQIKATAEEVEEAFKADGYECVLSREEADEQMRTTDPTINSTQCVHHIKNLQPKQFMADLDLSDVFVFAPGTDLHDNKMYCQGKVILQDKASCIPATMLAPPSGSHVIDSCAAPGNKTSHLASIMRNTGKIFAYDSAVGRYYTMRKLVPKAGVINATFHNQDFLETNPNDKELSSVEYIVVDPSCSGTGMVARKDYLINNWEMSSERLKNLACVQLKLLNHALSFPNVKRVVYSTCSIHAEENEDVVAKALKENSEFELKRVLPPWGQNKDFERKLVGEEDKDPEISRINSLCSHALPDEHCTNGFFVALFQKKNYHFDDIVSPQVVKGGQKRHIEEEEVEKKDEVHHVSKEKKRKKKKRKSMEEAEVIADTPQNGDHGGNQEDSEPMNTVDLPKSNRKNKKMRTVKGIKQDILSKGSVEDCSDHAETPSKAKQSKKTKRKSVVKCE